VTSYLSSAQVIALHQRALRTYGGEDGVEDLGLLEAALIRPQATFEGYEVYPRLETKAAALFQSLIKNRPFTDGNKRVAAAALVTFLEMNNWKIQSKPGELYALTLAVATDRATLEVVASWATSRKDTI
jgi:death-on-curing protein